MNIKTVLFILGWLCPFISMKAQTVPIQPLKIGDTIPEVIWQLPMAVVNHPQGNSTIALNDYRGKLIILDFWSNYCGVCIQDMPKVHQVTDTYQNRVVVLPVSWDDTDTRSHLLLKNPSNKNLKLFSLLKPNPLFDLFPHTSIPQYVWISPDGRVVAMSDGSAITRNNIGLVLQGQPPVFALKTYVDVSKPLLLNFEAIPADADVQFYSVFIKGFIPSLPSGTEFRKKKETVYGMACKRITRK